MQLNPTVGRIVHYVLDKGPHCGAHRPAIVVDVFENRAVALQVVTSGHKGDTPAGDEAPNVFWKPKCQQDEDRKLVGTWHWPEKTETA